MKSDLYEVGLKGRAIGVLKKHGITNQKSLALMLPKSYKDFRQLQLVKTAKPDKYGAFAGMLTYCDKRRGKRPYLVLRMTQSDNTPVSIMMFSETYRYEALKKMVFKEIVVYGVPSYSMDYGWQIKNPTAPNLLSTYRAHIEPVYSKVEGATEETLQKAISTSVARQREVLEEDVKRTFNLIDYPVALRKVHAPTSGKDVVDGMARIVFNDLLYFNLEIQKTSRDQTRDTLIRFPRHTMQDQFYGILPYSLTADQQMVMQTYNDAVGAGMDLNYIPRFNALVQGDVGCGKTVVAIAMMVRAAENGYQAVLMAPREVLAEQHYLEVKDYAEKLGLECVFLHSGMKAKEKKEKLKAIRDGKVHFIVGTHACVSDSVVYHRLGLTVTDEEHLFGVAQKENLQKKSRDGVHAVSMSATPIPRSLAQIIYGNGRTILAIKTKPAGRLPIKTATQRGHSNTFPFMLKQVQEGHQCYVVCPAIEDNDEFDIVSLEAMEKEYRRYFEPLGVKVGVVNGHMSKQQASDAVSQFASGQTDILMSTTVIEVGVNVPNATVIVIEQADRFGLASLHQLRGRVGRSSLQSYCILVSKQADTNARLQTMCRTNDGFEIAQADLEQRGSGDLFGDRQAGYNRFVDEMLANQPIFAVTQRAAAYCLENNLGGDIASLYREGECEDDE